MTQKRTPRINTTGGSEIQTRNSKQDFSFVFDGKFRGIVYEEEKPKSKKPCA